MSAAPSFCRGSGAMALMGRRGVRIELFDEVGVEVGCDGVVGESQEVMEGEEDEKLR